MRAFEVGVKGAGWTATVYAETAGKAKYRRLLDLREAWDGISFKDLTCHPISLHSAFVSTPGFLDCARRRGLPDARVGDKVKVEGYAGVIVGHNCSSNFNAYFEEGPHKGTIGNCYPGWRFEFREAGTTP